MIIFEEVGHKTDDMIKKRHADAFKYMGEGRLLDKKTETIMLDVLNVMYNPERNQRFKDYIGNPIRQVIEALFFAAHDKGLLPDECFDEIRKAKDDEKKVILLDCSRYMAGIDTKCHKRFGEKGKDGKGGDSIFPDDEATLLRGCINICNESSHFNPKKEKTCDEAYLGCALNLCHIISFFGRYVEAHPDVEANKSKIRDVAATGADQVKKSGSRVSFPHKR